MNKCGRIKPVKRNKRARPEKIWIRLRNDPLDNSWRVGREGDVRDALALSSDP